MVDTRAAIESLIADMKARILTVDDLRAAVEIAAIARQAAIPDIPDDLIPAFARATLLGAWIQYDIRRRHEAA